MAGGYLSISLAYHQPILSFIPRVVLSIPFFYYLNGTTIYGILLYPAVDASYYLMTAGSLLYILGCNVIIL